MNIRKESLKVMTTIQFVSDLHIEYNDDIAANPLNFITPSADILILAGDIGSFYKIKQLTNFCETLCPYFQIILYIPGNHEWYTIPNQEPVSLKALEYRMKKLENDINDLYPRKFYILNRNSVRIGNICIAGATLWTEPDCQVPPFIVRIHDITSKDYRELHQTDLKYLCKMIGYCEKNNLKLIVITHHPPTKKVLKDAKKRKKFESLYANDLDHLLDKRYVDTWISGHIHKNFDFVSEKGTRIISNQKGKPKDNITDYQTNFTLSL